MYRYYLLSIFTCVLLALLVGCVIVLDMPRCKESLTECGYMCANIENDPNNCGTCGTKCTGGMICASSKCACPSGLSDCSGICQNLTNDPNNCGKCGNNCASDQLCSNSQCVANCPTGQTVCSGSCADTTSDPNNCGNCGNKCALGQICTSGRCLYPSEVYISAGSFIMGSPSSELGRGSDEGPQRTVTLTRSFVIGKYEVTQGEFQALMGYNPSYFSSCGANCPVESVNWHEAVAYMNALSKSRGLEECFDCTGSGSSVSCNVKVLYSGQNYYNCKGYRLPTEAEWEYSYRAGTSTAFYNGDITTSGFYCDLDPNLDKIGWYCGNSKVTYAGCENISVYGGPKCAGTHPVGDKQANAWGLHDMAGNVAEWVYDLYQDSYSNLSEVDPVGPSTDSFRVVRGGGCNYLARVCRAASRSRVSPTGRGTYLGFRFLRSL